MNRRRWLASLAAVPAGMAGVAEASWWTRLFPWTFSVDELVLPEGLTARAFSVAGDVMDDGLPVPPMADGMGAFRAENGNVVLVRNHEIEALSGAPIPELAYDVRCAGGTTTVELGPGLEVVRHHMSLVGTMRNCAGGATPWGTWLSCEEIFATVDGRRHGYVFEVDPTARETMPPRPLRGLGRFRHEAAGVDPNTGAVYLTEDVIDGCFYRFVPQRRGDLGGPGNLQALAVGAEPRVPASIAMDEGKSVSCHWVDVPEPDPPIDDVRYQAQHAGAAVFVRGEGVTVLDDGVYFSSTEGGAERLGQLFRYVDSGPVGELELVYEVRDLSLLRPDNLTGAPWGDLVVCEDLDHGSNRLVGLRPDGSRYTIATNPVGEWAGACFGDDGTLFANVQRAGHSLAIVGLSADRAATIG